MKRSGHFGWIEDKDEMKTMLPLIMMMMSQQQNTNSAVAQAQAQAVAAAQPPPQLQPPVVINLAGNGAARGYFQRDQQSASRLGPLRLLRKRTADLQAPALGKPCIPGTSKCPESQSVQYLLRWRNEVFRPTSRCTVHSIEGL